MYHKPDVSAAMCSSCYALAEMSQRLFSVIMRGCVSSLLTLYGCLVYLWNGKIIMQAKANLTYCTVIKDPMSPVNSTFGTTIVIHSGIAMHPRTIDRDWD